MPAEQPDFDDLMIETSRATRALDSVTRRDGPGVTAAPLTNAKRVYSRLRDIQRSGWLTATEAHALDDALENLRVRLKFFGESV